MKVAYVLMQFPAPSETFASNDVRALVARGDQVTVFSMRGRHPDHDALVAERGFERLDVRPMSMPRALRALGRSSVRLGRLASLVAWIARTSGHRPRHVLASLALLPAAIAIADEVESEAFDVVHLFWGHYPSLVTAALRGLAPSMVRSIFLGAYDLVMGYGGSAEEARQADTVWTHARTNVSFIERLGVPTAKINVGYRGVDVPRLKGIREHERPSRVPYRLITVARLVASKRVDDVIRAFAQVRLTNPDASLAIVGDGPERPGLEALAHDTDADDAIEFMGHVPHDAALRAVARSQVFLLLSTKPDERLPNAAKEAMALDTVCIVTATPGIEELIEDGRTGFIVDGSDRDSVVACLVRALEDTPENEHLREAARTHIEHSFDVTVTMDAYCTAWAAAKQARQAHQG